MPDDEPEGVRDSALLWEGGRTLNFATKLELKENLRRYPKARPLAELLITQAALQEVTLEELTVAAECAVAIYADAMDPKSICVKGFESEAKATLESISGNCSTENVEVSSNGVSD